MLCFRTHKSSLAVTANKILQVLLFLKCTYSLFQNSNDNVVLGIDVEYGLQLGGYLSEDSFSLCVADLLILLETLEVIFPVSIVIRHCGVHAVQYYSIIVL